MFKDLFDQQETHYKSFLPMIMDFTNICVDMIVKDVEDVKYNLKFLQE